MSRLSPGLVRGAALGAWREKTNRIDALQNTECHFKAIMLMTMSSKNFFLPFSHQATVIQKVDNVISRINHHPADKH